MYRIIQSDPIAPYYVGWNPNTIIGRFQIDMIMASKSGGANSLGNSDRDWELYYGSNQ